MKKAMIVRGGWDGHDPVETTDRFAAMLRAHDFDVQVYDTLDPLRDLDALLALDLIVVSFTMSTIDPAGTRNVMKAVGAGVGLAGCHGGLCDAFRQDTDWQYMTGGQWVAHPGNDGVTYGVHVCAEHPITAGISDFMVTSEQYYMHVDPAIEVLATTRFPSVCGYAMTNKPVDMPVVWTKMWGNGRVFYTSLGHKDTVFANVPEASLLMERGMLWAAEGRAIALREGLTTDRFESGEML